jgi:hypothetical protein
MYLLVARKVSKGRPDRSANAHRVARTRGRCASATPVRWHIRRYVSYRTDGDARPRQNPRRMGLPLLALIDDLGPAMLAVDYLEKSAFDLQPCDSLGELWSAARRTPGSVALVDWRRIGGLLNPEHQHFLALVDQAAPVVLLLDDTFGQHMDAADLGVTAVLDSPILRAPLLGLLLELSHRAVKATSFI